MTLNKYLPSWIRVTTDNFKGIHGGVSIKIKNFMLRTQGGLSVRHFGLGIQSLFCMEAKNPNVWIKLMFGPLYFSLTFINYKNA